MRSTDVPVTTDLVLVGGGHAHVAVLKSFGMRPVPGVRLTLVARDVATPYSGMIPGHVAGHYPRDACHIDLGPLCRFAGARLVHAAATGIDMPARRLLVEGRPSLGFDLLSIDIGSTSIAEPVAGADEHALAAKPLDRFLARWEAVERTVLNRRGAAHILVAGAGAGGVELTLALAFRLATLLAMHGASASALRMTLVDAAPDIMPTHAPAVRRRLGAALARAGVTVRLGVALERIEADAVVLAGGERLPVDATVMVTGAAPAGWLRATGLALDERGFVRVDASLASVSHPDVFAAGDVAAFEPRPLPKSGVYAVRQGPVLADNLRRALTGRPLRAFRPQSLTLALVSTGPRRAVASWGRLALEGDWVWRWKNRLDTRWMRKYRELPEMNAGSAEGEAGTLDMRCGGCGAKVASPILRRVIERLEPVEGSGVLVGLEAADDVAVLKPPAGQVLVQSVDQFRAFVDDPYLFGRIAANHCLADLFAKGVAPHSALALVQVPFAGERQVEDDLAALLGGAVETLNGAGCALVGGHTGEGAELAFGLAVNGFADEGRIMRKTGAAAGDVLVLTRPLGTGALFAADMRGKARADRVEAALARMLRSSGPAAAILLEHGARACTDVTGFGLLGHLIEMLGVQLGAEIELAALPVLDGALDAMRAGIFSSLHPANRAYLARLAAPPLGIRAELLFDPQTAGGLLAALPPDRVDACLAALHAAGEGEAVAIGRIASDSAIVCR